MENLASSISQYKDQLQTVQQSLDLSNDPEEKKSLVELQAELQLLIQLTQESLDAQQPKEERIYYRPMKRKEADAALSMCLREIARRDKTRKDYVEPIPDYRSRKEKIEDHLNGMIGKKISFVYTSSWGAEPALRNAMVSEGVPFTGELSDLEVRVLFTHPTLPEMLPCPYYLNGSCKFDEEQCRYSHGYKVKVQRLERPIMPQYDRLQVGSSVLLKLKPPDNQDMNTVTRSTEKYHLWHNAVLKSVDLEQRVCVAELENPVTTGVKRKSTSEEYHVHFEDIFPLDNDDSSCDEADSNSDEECSSLEDENSADESISDTEYPESKVKREEANPILIADKFPALGGWERYTRGIGSKLMLAMGYEAGSGLGATGNGRVEPVEARVLPPGKSLDHCMILSEAAGGQDLMKVERRLKRLQKRAEKRNKKAYEREKEKERCNVFSFINKTLNDGGESSTSSKEPGMNIKQASNKDLNIENFKLEVESKKIATEVIRLKNTLCKYPPGTDGYRRVGQQIAEKNKELTNLKNKEQKIAREQKQRKDKQKLTIF